MKTITIKTQKQFDRLPKKFREWTEIIIKSNELILIRFHRGNSSVMAFGSSSVKAWGNSSVTAWDNSSVEALGNSSVKAWGNSIVRCYSEGSNISLFSYSVALIHGKPAKLAKKSKTCSVIIIPKPSMGLSGWLENNGIKRAEKITLYKRVSSDFKTQEGEKNETLWKLGTTVEIENWTPKSNECGEGKFHACSRPYFTDQFRSKSDDRYIAIMVGIKDLYAWPNPEYPHKIAFRKGKVMYECDAMGRRIK